MAEVVVEAHGLVKRYGEIVAVGGVDLDVDRGSVYGVLGPNGSGKSTTVRMLLGLARPNAGQVRLFGEPLSEGAPHLLRRVGAVVEAPAFVPYLSGRDNLRLLERYTPNAGRAGVEAALHRVHLEGAAHRRFKNYSLGMKQRLGIAAAILHNPELIILDEPTNGLDPEGTLEVRALIPELAAEGRTVILCSHLLYEVEQVCDNVAIFRRGRIIASGRTSELGRRESSLEIHVQDPEAALALLAGSRWAGAVRRDGEVIRIDGADGDGAEVNRTLAGGGIYAAVLKPIRPTLEDAFLEITREADARG
jgi:ABC-2 type transport system ATP-binding protein